MISVICPYNDYDLLQSCLIESVNKQLYKKFELVLIDSKEMNFESAADALNYGADKASGDILVFSHQDIQLLDNNVFGKIVEFCENNDFGIACTAGVSEKEHKVYSSVVQGPDKTQAGERIDDAMVVDACDECFFFIKKENFRRFADLGKTWHFYAVEYSLRCKLHGYPIYAVPLPIYHLSPGWSMDDTYWKTLTLLGKKYRGQIEVIPTTLGVYKNNALLPTVVVVKRMFLKIKHIIHGSYF